MHTDAEARGKGPLPFPVVIFDLDGTLVDTLPVVYRAYRYAVAPYRSEPSDEEIAAILGGPDRKGLEALLPAGAPLDQAYARLWRYGLEHRDEVELMPGAVELLDALQSAGCRLGLWTGRARNSAVEILRQFNLAQRFQAVVCGDDLPTHKPDPQGLFHLAELMGFEPSQAVLVGDSVFDVKAGRLAGVFTVAVGPQARQLEVMPDAAVADLVELRRLLCPPAGA